MSKTDHRIIVFQQPDAKKITTSKTELEILYDKFTQSANLPTYHFSLFMEMTMFENSYDHINSSLPSILIKPILKYCTPIIRDLPDFNVKKKAVNIFKKKESAKDEHIKKYYNITIQLEYPIECFFIKNYANTGIHTKTFDRVVIPRHDTLNIIGLFIPKNIVKYYNTAFLNYINSLSNNEILTSGKFGLVEFQSENYTQSRFDELRPKNISKNNNFVYFTANDDAIQKIKIIHKYINYTNNYYETNFLLLYKQLHIKPYLHHIQQQKQLYNIFDSKYDQKRANVRHNSVYKQFASLIKYELDDNLENNDFIFDHHKLYDDIQKILICGNSHPASKKIIQNIDLRRDTSQIISEYKAKKFQIKLKYAKLRAIAFKKFQTHNLDSLSASQKKIVILEHDQLEKYYDSMKKHTIEFDLVNSLYWAMDNGKKKLIDERLKEISKIVDIPKDIGKSEKMLPLKKSKNAGIICPHNIIKAQMLITPFKNEIQRSGKIRQFLIDNFSLPVIEDGYFCRICGEMIAEYDDEEITKFISGKRVTNMVEIDRLKNQIWREVAHIITSFVKFKNAVNYKHIINNITGALRPEMGEIEVKLSKIKSNAKDSIKDLMGIYICTYTLALVSNMIINNYGKITFSYRPTKKEKVSKFDEKKGGVLKKSTVENSKSTKSDQFKSVYIDDLNTDDNERTANDNEYMSDLITNKEHTIGGKSQKSQIILQNVINNALFIIVHVKNVAINSVTSISVDSIKPMLIKAYQWASKLKEDHSHISEEKQHTVDIKADYIYKYVEQVLRLNEDKSYSIKDVLGRTWNQIESDFKSNTPVGVFDTVVIPPVWGDDGQTKTKYKYNSFKFFIEYVKNKLYNVDTVPFSAILSNHIKKYEFLKDLEQRIHNSYKFSILRPLDVIKMPKNFMMEYNNFDRNNIFIEKYYDNSGNAHKFDIVVYQKANNKGVFSGAKKEYTKNKIVELLDSKNTKILNELYKMFVVDYRCSVCNNLMSQVKNKTVEREMRKNDNLRLFYKYFESICPKGELHDFKLVNDKERCSKCDITKKIFDNMELPYYKKYWDVYEKIQRKKLNAEKNDISKLVAPRKKMINNKKYPNWKINNAPMLELSRKFKVKYNIWINLGLSINTDYNLIKREKINPSAAMDNKTANLRNNQLFSYFLFAVKQLSMIKYYLTVDVLPYELKNLMNKNKVSNLEKKLVIDIKDTPEKYYYYKLNLKPAELSNFLLHSLSDMLLNIHKTMKKIGVNIAHELIKYIISKIIVCERLVSKPDLTRFRMASILSNEIDESGILIEDADGDQVKTGYISEDDENVSLMDMSDTEPDDPFTLSDMDIEVEEE